MAETIISPGVFQRENDISFISPAPAEIGACVIGPTVKGPVEIPTTVTSYNEYVRVFGETFESASSKQEFFTSIAAKNYFSQGGNSLLVARVVTGSFTAAGSTHISSSENLSNQPFQLETIGKGTIYNSSGNQNSDSSLVNGTSDNLRWEISNKNEAKGTFTLSVRRGDDNLKNKIVLETFNNLSLDPNSSNYIEKVIGNQVEAINGAGDNVSVTGEYINRSKYIRVSAVSPTINFIGNDGNRRLGSLTGSLPINESGSFSSATGAIVVGGDNYYDDASTRVQGLTAENYTKVITLLGNSDDYKFNVLTAPGLNSSDHSSKIGSLIDIAESRGDCIFIADLYGHGATVSNVTGQADVLNSSYAASYWPWLQTQSATGKNVWAPASVFIPGVYAFTDGSSAPWFAPAGLIRGGLAGVIQAERRLSRTDRDSLYDSKVNPIATFPGTGIAVFGQKTLQTKASALDRVNVRRLLIELKEFLGNQAQNLVFEQNTVNTRNKFLSSVNPYLDSVVQRQGLYSYRVVMDDTNNSADVIDRNQLVGQIFIQPAKTAEFIVLDFTVEPTGATFGA
jgi:uncharacterized protein